LLQARLAVDEARLRFYELSRQERDTLLAAHEQRQTKSASEKAQIELSEAEKLKEKARKERERAERELAAARSEAAKRLGSERVRLLEVRESQAALAADLAQEKVELAGFSEQLLAWLNPADDVIKTPARKRPSPARIDMIYDELTRNLDETREDLSAATDAVGEPPQTLARVGEDALGDLPVDVDRTEVDELRADLLASESQIVKTFEKQQWERMRKLMEAMTALDKRRLELLPLISDDKRSNLNGFTAQAFEQAGNELAQVLLVLRYHWRETTRFVSSVRETGDTEGSAFTATITALKWMIPIGIFIWWRRRAKEQLRAWRRAAVEAARKKRLRGKTRVERVIQFYSRIRNPFEWLVLVWSVFVLLPRGANDLLEVQLLSTALSWMLGGQLVVNAIDAWFHEGGRHRKSRLQTAQLRFQTLRLLGRVVVTFGLILALTHKLVGEGTIYEWVWTICWLSVVPIFLLILRWWRNVLFHYVELQRKKGTLVKWVEANQEGWQSFPAAVAGGAYLLSQFVLRFVRVYVLGFDFVKRILAYWFRREVEKQSESRTSDVGDADIEAELYDTFDPEHRSTKLVPSVADKQVDEVIERIHLPGGAVFALVGERGSGKTTLLERIHEKTPDTSVIRCPVGGIAEFHKVLRRELELDEDASDEDVIDLLNKRAGDNALLLDDAQHLVRPVVDGLEEFDRLIVLARSSSVSCTWVFAFDAVIWQFFKRAREVRPLFDDIIELRPWSEEGIVRLLGSRSDEVELDADFSRLMAKLPPDADEVDAQEALERARNGFYRLLWDYSLGNPGVSLHFWRESLRCAPDGTHIVRLFEPPDTSDLDRLPDSTVFVLRAVVQLERAAIDEVVEATMLGRRQVEDSISYALRRGYLEEVDGRYRIRWKWFRTITRFLARKHLLSTPTAT
jgi:flagellar biosynthesis GTPase FlhF